MNLLAKTKRKVPTLTFIHKCSTGQVVRRVVRLRFVKNGILDETMHGAKHCLAWERRPWDLFAAQTIVNAMNRPLIFTINGVSVHICPAPAASPPAQE